MPASPAVKSAADVVAATNNANAMILNLWGYELNLMTVLILGLIFMLFYAFYSIQSSQRLDFADMFTKDGRKVSATKVLQFIAGVASTWFIIKQGLQGTLSVEMFAVYLAFMASVEGFSKFISAKYNYKETSMREANTHEKDKNTRKLMASRDGGDSPEVLLDLDGDGPVEASVTEVTDAAGSRVVEKKIKKG